MDQQSFGFDDTARQRRRSRRRLRSARRASAETLPLAEAPVVQTCGRCGLAQTLLAETALCANCGAIIVRKAQGEDEASWVEPATDKGESPTEED